MINDCCALRTPLVQKLMDEVHKSSLYDTTLLADGDHANDFLKNLAEHSSDHHDVCREVPLEGFEDGYDPLGPKFGATSLPSFSELVEGVRLSSVVKVVIRYGNKEQSATSLLSGLITFKCALACRCCGVACHADTYWSHSLRSWNAAKSSMAIVSTRVGDLLVRTGV